MDAAYHRSGNARLTGTEPRRVFSLTLVSAGRGFLFERPLTSRPIETGSQNGHGVRSAFDQKSVSISRHYEAADQIIQPAGQRPTVADRGRYLLRHTE